MRLQIDQEHKTLDTEVFEAFAHKSKQIIRLFHILYYLLIGFLAIGAWAIFTRNSFQPFFYNVGVNFGRAALVLLGIVVLPGILGRFGIDIKLTRIITLFRRQLGILVFLLAFIHFSLVKGLVYLAGIMPSKLPAAFEILGFSALTLLFLMFITSNNFSQKKLGRWWKKLHRIVYGVLWLLVLHTGLQRISVWSLYILIFAMLEIASWVFYFSKKKPPASP